MRSATPSSGSNALVALVTEHAFNSPWRLSVEQLEAIHKRLAADLLAKPGGASYAHGDATLENVFFDAESEQTWLIDVETLLTSVGAAGEHLAKPDVAATTAGSASAALSNSKAGNESKTTAPDARLQPMGCAARDICNFVHKLVLGAVKCGIKSTVFRKLEQHFLSAYRESVAKAAPSLVRGIDLCTSYKFGSVRRKYRARRGITSCFAARSVKCFAPSRRRRSTRACSSIFAMFSTQQVFRMRAMVLRVDCASPQVRVPSQLAFAIERNRALLRNCGLAFATCKAPFPNNGPLCEIERCKSEFA